ncbi:hypothetical protein CANARDRAFT_188575, partial [[Candida] arabinofermentans NRRL YB-2248]
IAFLFSLVLAAYLGFANISLPHDKLIHFAMFFVMSFLFYWILEFKSQRIIRNCSFIICTIVGGIGSEFIQHVVAPERTFDWYDIVANVAGSIVAIVSSSYYHACTVRNKRTKR